MEVKNVSEIKLTRNQKRRVQNEKKKVRMDQEIGNGDAESKEEKRTEQSSPPRKKGKKMNGNNSSVAEKKSGSCWKEEADTLKNTPGNTGSEPGPKEEPAVSETKGKRKKKKKAQMNAESGLELKDNQENHLIDENNKVSDSHLKISKNLVISCSKEEANSLKNTLGNTGSEPGPKDEPAGSETKRERKKKKKKMAQMNAESALELKDKQENHLIDENNKVSDSHLKTSKEEANSLKNTLGITGSEPGPKEEPAVSETKRERKKKKKTAQMNAESALEMKDKQENPLIDENNKVSDSHLKISNEEANSLKNTLGNTCSEPGPKEEPAVSETKRERKKKKKQAAQMNAESAVELKDKQENHLIDENNKVTDSHLKISNEEANSLKNTLGNTGSEPGPKEEPAASEKKRKRKKKKMAETNSETALELKDKQENPLVDENNKVSDSHLKISKNLVVSENLLGLQGAQLNESETKSERKKRKRDKTKICAIEDEYISSKSNAKDNNENMCAETQIMEGKDMGKEDLMSISEAVEPKHCISLPTQKKKLLVLDLNGILVDVVQGFKKLKLKPHKIVGGKGVFRRPFCDDFLDFCFRTFDVAIWSSRLEQNVTSVVNFIMGRQWKHRLLFCWGRKMCTITKFKTLENQEKPLVLKELKKIWEKGDYNESNTLLLDDSPYKALRNPANTAIFPYIYQCTDAEDRSLASGGDIRTYLERLAAADNVQKFVEQNPFGQPAITEADPHWDFYSQI